MRVICTGMPRSASTWSYNAARLLMGDPACGYIGSGLEPDAIDKDMQAFCQEHDEFCVKCHYPGPWTRSVIKDGQFSNIFTHRDPRDAVASLMFTFKQSFDQAMQQMAVSYGCLSDFLVSDTLFIPYRDIVQNPEGVITYIASYLEMPIGLFKARKLATELSLEKTRERLKQLNYDENRGHEPKWLYHNRHVNDGIAGVWRTKMTVAEADEIFIKFNKWFKRFGYDK